jgi:hypothetical protein
MKITGGNMKVITGLIIGIMLCGTAWAATERTPSVQYSRDQLVASGRHTIYGLIVNFKGVTVGDKVEIKDGLTSSATVDASIYAATANGTLAIPLLSGISLDTGLYLDETLTTGGASTDIQYQ